jgi:hypothetical protein
MEDNRCSSRSRSYAPAWFLALACAGLVPAYADTRVIEVTNKTGKDVDDLHIVFTNDTTVDTVAVTTPFDSDRVTNAKTHNLYGATVLKDGTAKVRFTTADGTAATFETMWWTKGGTAVADGQQEGDRFSDNKGKYFSMVGGPATGNGQLLVTVGPTNCLFQTTAGHTAAQSADDLRAAMDGCGLPSFAELYSVELNVTTVNVRPNRVNIPGGVLHAQVLTPDSTLVMTVLEENVPTLSEWGIVALTLALVAAGIVMALRSRYSHV